MLGIIHKTLFTLIESAGGPVVVNLVKKIDLNKHWEDAYIEINAPTYKDLKDMTEVDVEKPEESVTKGISVLENLFVSGKLGSPLVDVKKEDLIDLPIEVLTEVFQLASGTPDPNA